MTHQGIGSGPDQAIAYPIGGVGLNAPDLSTNYKPRTRPCQEHGAILGIVQNSGWLWPKVHQRGRTGVSRPLL